MESDQLNARAAEILQKLCKEIQNRDVGTAGNRRATDFFASTIAKYSFETSQQEFDCLDWVRGIAELSVNGESYQVAISPYSLGCTLHAPLMAVATVPDLATADLKDKILLLHGEIAKEQLMPKNFPFYNPEHHQQIYQLLEEKTPLAIISATGRNPETAGGIYPFPLIEDGDFNIPTVTITDLEGERLLNNTGEMATLKIDSKRVPAKGFNVIARRGAQMERRVVICAHIDAKPNTPGAIDNGTGVAVLLLLAELLQDYCGQMGVEIVALNGEDHYSAAGQKRYLQENAEQLTDIVLAINLDGAGYYEGLTEYSCYDCPAEIEGVIERVFSDYVELRRGEQWYQSDHMIFAMNGRPAMAITSQYFLQTFNEITHTPKDHPGIVDVTKLVTIAGALAAFITELEKSSG